MKHSLSLILFFLTISIPLFAQQNYLVGKTTTEEIREKEPIFGIYANRYQPDSTAIEFLANLQDSVTIKTFFGTWCHDSKREVPAFMKTIELANNPLINVEYVALSRNKTDPEGLSQNWGLQYTPTFIIVSQSKEIGRIVEESTEKIEVDLMKILTSGVR